MRHDFIDRFSRLKSPVHRLPASLKLTIAVAVVMTVMMAPIGSPVVYGIVAAILIGAAAASRIPPAFLVKRLLFLEPFVVAIAALSLLKPGGLWMFLAIVCKSTLSLFTMILLSNTTRFTDILGVLREIGIPSLLVTVLALMYRYLFVLIDEAERMTRARASRTFAAGRLRLWKSAASVVSQMFIRSSERAERIYAAMLARGWK
jgi:cobalt/nickel transport system permease protein